MTLDSHRRDQTTKARSALRATSRAASAGTLHFGAQAFARRLRAVFFNWLPLLALIVPPLAQAQAWPTKPVRIVVPFSVGGTADLLSRVVGEGLQKATGQPFVIDSKPGAGGAIGAVDVARAPADGHTLLLATSSTHSVAPAVKKQLPYNAVEDFTPIALLSDANNLLLVSTTVDAKNMKDLLALAKQKPGFLNYTSGGIGTQSHLAFELFKAEAGVDITHVPYKGVGAATSDLMTGAVHLSFDSIPTGLPHAKAGRVRGMAVTGKQRSRLVPDLPTIAESGVPGFSNTTWYGIYGPKGLSPQLAQRINEEINKVLHAPEMQARFEQLGIEAARGSPSDFAKVAAAERERWARLVRERDIKLD